MPLVNKSLEAEHTHIRKPTSWMDAILRNQAHTVLKISLKFQRKT